MNAVERVKSICKERKIPISKLERDLDFGNGYIGQLRKGMFPADRLAKIAEYLSISEEYILTGQEIEKAPADNGERKISDDEIKAAFFEGADDLSKEEMDAMWDDARDYIQYKLEQRRRKNHD